MANMLTDLMDRMTGAAGRVVAEESAFPGPSTVGPTDMQAGKGGSAKQLVPKPMTEEQREGWWREINIARERRRTRAVDWDVLLDEYMPLVSPSGSSEALKVNQHFRDVHSKVGQLFYRCPDVVLEPLSPSALDNQMPNPMAPLPLPGVPAPPAPPLTMVDIVATKQAVLNNKIGKDGIKMQRLMDELLFDTLAWAGFGVSKLGYRCVTKAIQMPKMMDQPMPGSILGIQTQPQPMLDPAGQPVMETVEVPVYEHYYNRRISPKKALWSPFHNSTRFDEDAAWVGFEFFMSKPQAIKAFGLSEEDLGKTAKDDLIHPFKADSNVDVTNPDGLVHGIEIFCRSELYTDEVHPQAIHQLVLIEGLKEKDVVWRPSPDQEFDQQGQLTDDSLIGFPIRFLHIRDLADSAFTPSDAAFTNSGIKELTTYRRQDIVRRNAAAGRYMADGGAFDKEDIQAIQNSECGTVHIVEAGQMTSGIEKIFALMPQVKNTPDDYRGQQLIKHELNETVGMSSNQAGTPEDTVRTATEIANVQTNISARNSKEQSRAVEYYVDCVRMIDQLLMRYATEEDFVKVTGKDGAMRWMIWKNDIIAGRFLYDIAPDSQLKIDTHHDKERLQRLYNLTAADPLVNRAYLLRRMARAEGLDPAQVILNPMEQMAQAPHGGENNPANKHAASNSGGRPNEPGAGNHRAAQGAQIGAVTHGSDTVPGAGAH